jgi:WD40 repeat protein
MGCALVTVAAVPSEIPALRPETVSVPDHELLRRIGKGAYGEVWLARSVLGAARAVKIIWRDRFEHPRPFEREFQGIREFEPLSRQHEGLIDILQVGRQEDASWFYYVMELADGIDDAGATRAASGEAETYVPRTLHEELARRKRLSVADVATLGMKLADALAYLHRHGLVHRDLKPSNILFVRNEPRLGDVGLVAQIGGAMSFVGTEGYIAPEGPGTPAADIYALGLVLYEAATGLTRHDFPQLPPALASSEEAEDFAELNAVLLRACAAKARDRYASAEKLRDDLRAVAGGRSIRRQRQLEGQLARLRNIGIVAVCVALLAAAGWWWQQRAAGEARADAVREASQVAALAAKERELRVNLFAADMNQGGVAVRAGNLGRARELLRAWAPQAGIEDVRDEAWSYLMAAASGDRHRTFSGHARNVAGLSRSPDGTTLYSCGFDGTLREWNLSSGAGRVLATKEGEPFYEVTRIGDGDFVLAGGKATWRWQAGNGAWQKLGAGAARHLGAHPDAGWVATGGKTQFFGTDEPVEILSLDGSGSRRKLAERSGRVAVSNTGQWLATGEVDGKCVVYATATWERIKELESPGQIVALAFSPDDRWLAGALREGGVALWDLTTQRLAFRGEGHARQVVWCLAFSPDSRWLASGGSDQTVHLWNVAAGRLEQVLRGHEDEVWSVVFAPDGRWLASSGKDETVRVWPLDTPEAAPRPEQVAGRTIFSADSRWLACAQKGGALCVLDAATLAPAGTLPADEVPLAFSEQDHVLLSSPRGRQLTHWNWRQGTAIKTVPLADAGATGDRLALSPNRRWLAMVLTDGRLAVWSAETGALVFQSKTNEPLLHELVFSPDDQWLAT